MSLEIWAEQAGGILLQVTFAAAQTIKKKAFVLQLNEMRHCLLHQTPVHGKPRLVPIKAGSNSLFPGAVKRGALLQVPFFNLLFLLRSRRCSYLSLPCNNQPNWGAQPTGG